MSLATVTTTGRAFLAKVLKEQSLHIAWGAGDPAWDDLEDSSLPGLVNVTGLTAELGRRAPSSVGYVLPDDDGAISIPVGMDGQGNVLYQRYTLAETPTPWLYVRCNFDNADAASATIREMGLFGGGVAAQDLPPGQQYFTPDEIEDPGFLIAVEIVRPRFSRSPNVRESYEFVLPL
ncbi:MAG: hypothetical protein FWF31_08990 [Desulfobulbus sp.]|nr:hypothetical protein [Desulfobulbus sp.]